jgi:hypothetical protein
VRRETELASEREHWLILGQHHAEATREASMPCKTQQLTDEQRRDASALPFIGDRDTSVGSRL